MYKTTQRSFKLDRSFQRNLLYYELKCVNIMNQVDEVIRRLCQINNDRRSDTAALWMQIFIAS